MSLYSTNIPEGLRFETLEDAQNYFESTLVDESTLGSVYQDLHNHDFGKYELQATTGLNEDYYDIVLDYPDIKNNYFKRVFFNSHGVEKEFTSEELITQLNEFIKSTEFASLVVDDALDEIATSIQKGEDKYSEFNWDNHIISISTEYDIEGARVVIAVQKDGEQPVFNTIPFVAGDSLKEDVIIGMVEGFFINKIEGKVSDQFKAGNIPCNHLLDRAIRDGKTLRLEIVD